MRYMALAGALAFALYAGICGAEDESDKSSSGAVAVTRDAASPSNLKHIDLGDNSQEPVTRVGVMDPGQSYDGSTGLPNVVESDSDMDTDT